MAAYETPSRIWRRIQDDREPSSLPSLPGFEHSMAPESTSDDTSPAVEENETFPVHSTPVALSSYTATPQGISTIKLQSSTSSTARFATSIASRSVSAKSSASQTYSKSAQNSFDVSPITSHQHDGEQHTDPGDFPPSKSTNSVPEAYLPPLETDEGEDMSLADALESVSRSSSPISLEPPLQEQSSKKGLIYDYSVSLRSEPKPSPFDKYRNVAMRKTTTRARTPSLSRTTPSPVSSPPNSTPRSNHSARLIGDTPSPIPGIHTPLPMSASPSSVTRSFPSVIVQPPDQETQYGDEEPEPSSDGYENHRTIISDMVSEGDDASPEHGPTWSSLSDPMHPVNFTPVPKQSPVVESRIIPSPGPSTYSTLTPTPRPRPRFNAPYFPGDSDLNEDKVEPGPDQVTPRTRRRSFLLSVINSTTRPRMKPPTPHPRRLSMFPVSEDSSDEGQATPTAPLRKAFAGVTPRPGRGRGGGRLSHPLTQVHVPVGIESASETGDGTSNYDSAGERMSFISTASSHDLTTHVRANTSYDPAIGLGERGKTGRFDAQRLNAYLHGLNRRLQDENAVLAERLRKYEDVTVAPRLSIVTSEREQRLSAGGMLGDVEEDADAEGWAEEKLELEALVQKTEEEVANLSQEKAQLQKALEDERDERARDKGRWQERMREVESGVADIINELEGKLDEAEVRRVEALEEIDKLHCEAEKEHKRLEGERNLALERAGKAENALESGKELGGTLREANSKVSALTGELQVATALVKELEAAASTSEHQLDELKRELKEEKLSAKLVEEDFHGQLGELGTEVMRASARIVELETAVSERNSKLKHLEEKLHAKSNELMVLERRVAEGNTNATEEIQMLKAFIAESEESSARHTKLLNEQLSAAHDCIAQFGADEEQTNDRMEMLQSEVERASELARQLEDALEAAEEKMKTDEEALAELKAKLIATERHQDSSKQFVGNELEEALEAELDDANKEIARLNALLQQSPARKAVEKAKDARIEMLEREKEELLGRMQILRANTSELMTPSKVSTSGISPIHRHLLSMSMRAPKTPGGPLRDLSWLNNTTVDPTVSPLLAEIARLQTELDRANENIDQKLNELEDAGVGVIGLTRSLEDAREQLALSEREIARLKNREERRLHRLQRLRCHRCLVKIETGKLQRIYDADGSSMDISQSGLCSNPPIPPTKTSEALRQDLQSVHAQLDAMRKEWQEEKRRLLGEKAVLEDAANRMKIEVHSVKEEAKRAVETARLSSQSRVDRREVDGAKTVISDLESGLQAERARLRQMSTGHERLQRETQDIVRQLQRTETDMEEVKQQLHKAKQENHDLEGELRANANVEQKARILEARVLENTETIEQFRQERSLLARNHKDLQRQFTEVTERARKARDDYAALQISHEGRRQQLDACVAEVDELRHALENQIDELQRTEQEKNRIVIENCDIARTIANLEADLRRVKKDAEEFGRDLKALKAEKMKMEEKQKEETARAERARKQSQTQIRLLSDQLESQKAKTARAKEGLQRHVCSDDQQLEALEAQHKQECKGLIVQIRYLKAKFTRESTLRDGLSYQKQYLLVLLSSFEASEKRILACIASIGYPKPSRAPAVTRRHRTFKNIVLGVIFIHRAQCASNLWREACINKQAIADALQEVRYRRAMGKTR